MRLSTRRYQAYLKSEWWQRVRAVMLYRANYTCQDCGWRARGVDGHWLEVHHLFYQRLGNEWVEDMVVLCGSCHGVRHGEAPEPFDPMAKYSIRRILPAVLDQVETAHRQLAGV